jgi:dTDP-4-dehydrorhamnose reductase
MQVVVLGSAGMLGNYIHKYFKDSIGLTKVDVDASKETRETLKEKLKKFEPIETCIVNCIGVVMSRISEVGIAETIQVNSVFPHILSDVCKNLNLYLIGTATDRVFSGRHVESYIESDLHDADDIYGKSKSLGENDNCTFIRTSIIGEEVNNVRSLVEWMKKNINKKMDGDLNHFWNGITALEFAKCVEKIIEKDLFWKGIMHIHSPQQVCKLHLLQIINDVYGLKIFIKPTYSKQTCSRVLSSEYDVCSFLNIAPLDKQIEEMKDFNICGF